MPTWASTGVVLAVLLAVSTFVRTRYIGGQFWVDEAIPTGIVSQALMLYTHSWGIFFAAGSAVALYFVYRVSDDRRLLVRDAVMAFAGAGLLYLPWLPNFIYQATHTGDPWAPSPKLGAPVLLSRDLMGGDRVTTALVIASIVGLMPLFAKAARRTREATAMWALILIPTATLLIAWLASQVTPAFI